MAETFEQVKALLSEVNKHYSEDNIKKRNNWIQWVNSQATEYDNSILNLTSKMESIEGTISDIYLDFKRNTILDFAARVNNPQYQFSKEHFTKVFKVYADYENYIKEHNLKNGEVDIAHKIITKAYEYKLENDLFTD